MSKTNENQRKAVTGKIETFLNGCTVSEGHLSVDSFRQPIETLEAELMKFRGAWLSTNDSTGFIFDYLLTQIEYKKEYSGKLSNMLGKDEIIKATNEIFTHYENIPNEYIITFPMPQAYYMPIANEIKLNNNCKFTVEEPCQPRMEGILWNLENPFSQYNHNEKNLSFTQNISGYITRHSGNKTLLKCINDYKVFLGLAIINGYIRKKNLEETIIEKYALIKNAQINKNWLRTKNISNASIIEHELPPNISFIINEYVFEADPLEPLINYPALSNLENSRKGVTAGSNLINCKEPEAEKLRAAIKWYFDSVAEKDPTISFLQICIGLEALLGGSEQSKGVTDTLADRCAYIIGSTFKTRSISREKFKKLYQIRSKIVHGNSIRLDEKEENIKDWGLLALEQCTKKELQLLEMRSE